MLGFGVPSGRPSGGDRIRNWGEGGGKANYPVEAVRCMVIKFCDSGATAPAVQMAEIVCNT